MPTQTVLASSTMRVPDGCAIYVDPDEGGYHELGVIMSETKLTLNWESSQEETANAGKLDPVTRSYIVEGSFQLGNLAMDVVTLLFGGMFTSSATPGSENSAIPDQIIASGWTDHEPYELIPYTSSSDDTILKLPDQPVFTSVKIATSTTPETLVEDDDYVVIEDPNSRSGWAIVFIEAGMTETGNGAITIDWGANTPTARTTYYVGTSSLTLTPFKMKLEHTDSASLVRGREIFRCFAKPGSFSMGYKGANETGHEVIEFSFEGVIDTALTDGRQLLSLYEDTGAA
jgi:hypothetical protein